MMGQTAQAATSSFGNELDDAIARIEEVGRLISAAADHMKGPAPEAPRAIAGAGALSRLLGAVSDAEGAVRRLLD